MSTIVDLDRIFEEIRSRDDNAVIYMVLDTALKDELPTCLWRQNAPDYAVPLFECGNSPDMVAVSPFLVAMDGKGPDRYLTELAGHEPAGIFLVAHEPRLSVLEQARAWLWPQKENGQPVYFRYYDPRVCSAALLFYDKRGSLWPMGSFEQVFWHDPLRGKTFRQKARQPGKPFTLSAPWRLSAELEEELASARLLHRVSVSLPGMNPDFYRHLSPAEIYEGVEVFAAQAEGYGFLSFADILPFCHVSFMYPSFTEQENIRVVFEGIRGRRHNRSFDEVLGGLSDEWLLECKPYGNKYYG
jgi:hypothetical protein